MTIRSLFALPARRPSLRGVRGLWLAIVTASLLAVTACTHNVYQFPLYNFAGRPIPPSQLAQRVMVGVTFNGANGGLIILDGLRDIRNNIENTIPGYSIAGYSGGYPSQILSFPEQMKGYVYSNFSPYPVNVINYSSESSTGSVGSFAQGTSVAIAPDFIRIFASVAQAGQLIVNDQSLSTAVALNLPNVTKVVVNRGDTVALAMVRNSNTLYRIIKLNAGTTVNPPGAVDCQPSILPLYCVIPVPGNFDRPIDAVFSLDGSSVYVLNCGQECGGGSNGGSGVSVLPQGALQINLLPTAVPYPAVVTSTTPIPGGVTTAILDGTTLYAAGQQLQPDGLFSGRLSLMNTSTLAVGTPIPISDGTHTKLLFADDNTLWIGSQYCSTGERAKLGLNYNCLTRYDITAGTAAIVPALNAATSTTPPSVPYPNADNNLQYYGSLTGLCWVQNYHKVYTAYGGQVHAFYTSNGQEINNTNFTVQGTALDVAYIDALTNSAN